LRESFRITIRFTFMILNFIFIFWETKAPMVQSWVSKFLANIRSKSGIDITWKCSRVNNKNKWHMNRSSEVMEAVSGVLICLDTKRRSEDHEEDRGQMRPDARRCLLVLVVYYYWDILRRECRYRTCFIGWAQVRFIV